MTDIDDLLRRTLGKLADEARPARLGTAALAGALRRQRRRRAGVLTAVAVAIATVAVPIGLSGIGRQGSSQVVSPTASRPDTEPAGPYVVTGYAGADSWHLLDPRTGSYRKVDGGLGAVSPNLERAVTTDTVSSPGGQFETSVRIWSTAGGPPEVAFTADGWLGNAEWSPDGNWVLLTDFPGDDDPGPDRGYHKVVLVDAISGMIERPTLTFGDRYGHFVQWGDNSTLLAATSSVPRSAGPGVRPDRLAVLRRDGSLVRTVPLPKGEPCAPTGSAAQPPPVADGMILLCTVVGGTGADRGEGVVTTLRWDGTGPDSEMARVPPPADRRLTPVAWDGQQTVVWAGYQAEAADHREIYVAGLDATEFGPPVTGVPEDAVQVLVGSSLGLSAKAAHLAF